MTLRDAFGGVDVLLPARVHKARERAAQAIRSDLSALIETLPTSSSSPAPAHSLIRTPNRAKHGRSA